MQRAGKLSSLALMAVALATLLAASSAAAAVTYEVDSVANEPDQEVGVAGCKSAAGKCTLRAAIEESNDTVGVRDTIVFSPAIFNGQQADTIEIGGGFTLIADPVTIDGGQCPTEAGVEGPCAGINGAPGLDVTAHEVVVKGLAITAADTAISVYPGGDDFEASRNWMGQELDGDFKPNSNGLVSIGLRTKVVGNLVQGSVYGITFNGPASGGRIEGNTIRFSSGNGIQMAGSSNKIFGNAIEESSFSAIYISGAATGNQVGGETTDSENVVEGSTYSPIVLVTGETTQNEVARNRGSDNGGKFISIGKSVSADPNFPNGGIQPPPITASLQSSATGTAEPGARIRVFRKATDQQGEIAGFLGATTADDGGDWTVEYAAQIPAGTNIAVSQTDSGGTSELGFAVAAPDPAAPCTVNCGGNQPPPAPPVTPDTTKPKVTIVKAPKAKSTATTGKFVFTSDEAGSTFKCKLDKKAFASCKSPKTYKKLVPGKHVFKLKATDTAGNVSAVVTRTFTVLE